MYTAQSELYGHSKEVDWEWQSLLLTIILGILLLINPLAGAVVLPGYMGFPL
ncbi:hypothetical protein [Methanosarcina horonobensis]|uniref:hypothetical protein n=1 Tax=Methanosarcina horonobensis TaxID=418008 RepID=UPI0022B8CC4E|nr:hypothetical protein [Methanosarcina horonobensis]